MSHWMNPFAAEHPGALAEGARYNGYKLEVWTRILERAVWAADMDHLNEIASCRCCCHEHTFNCCPARAWGGCRGQGSDPRGEAEAWAAFYAQFHGMTREEFFR